MRATSTVRLFRRALTNSTALVAIALRPAAALRMVPAASPFPSIHDLAVGLVAFGMESAAALSTPLGRAARVMAASAVVTLLPLGISDRSGTAYAMGGAGSAGNMTYGGSGGADSETGGGGAGHPGVQAGGGGGGGGAGLTGANGGSGVNYGENYGGDTPGAGGAGGRTGENGSRNGAGGGNATNNGGSGAGGGGGGGGATGYSSLGSEPALPSAELGAVAGGTGGQGGTGVHVGGGGGGGGGGYGAIITGNGTDLGTLTVNITGGNGGQGGSGYRGGNGGTGGTGLTIDGATFTNDATIMGGTGGGGGTGSNMDGSAGASGAGISGSSLTITDTANGRIVGGGTGAAQSDAIIFTSGTNVLNYGGTIIGNLAITAAGTTLQINASAAGSTVANVITGGGAIIQNSPNTLALTGVNTYTGGTTIAQGILQVSAVPQTLTSMSLGTGSVLLNGGTLQAAPQDNGGGENTGPATSNYNFALQNDIQIGTSSRIDVNGNSLTLSGNITDRVAGTGTLTVINSGGNGSQALTLSGDNTFAGGLIVGGSAVVRLGASNAAGSGALAIDADAALDLNANDQSITALTGSGAIGNSSGASSSTLAVGSGAFAGTIADGFSGAAGGRVALAKMSDGTVTGGTLVLTGANTYTGGTTVAGGTLQIGNGGTAGSIAGNVVDNAALAFARSDVFTYGGVVSGTGSLTQAGPGTLVLTGANTYTGGTTVALGSTLALAGRGSIAASSFVANDGTLDLSASAKASFGSLGGSGMVALGPQALTLTNAFGTFSGAISGSGSLAIQSGKEVLTGTNTYTGASTVAFGSTLQLGDGGSAGSIIGPVVDEGTLAFARRDSSTYAGAISGAGAVVKAGAGTLTLSGANTYAGGTLLRQGALAIGSGTALGTGRLAMDDGTALRFTAPDVKLGNSIALTGIADPTINTGSYTATLTGDIAGEGALTKQGNGTLILLGTDTATGATRVAAGTLEVDGSAAATAVTVGNGATLSGTGSVGSIAAGAGATVSPGSAANPYGVLRTPGSAAFVKTATYRVAIDATGQNSALAVNGTATLGAAAVTVASTPGAYNAATRYTILTAAGGVQGVFGTLTTAQALAFLSPYLTYTADAVTLNFRTNGTSFADIATTPNERSAALAIQSLDPNGALARSLQGLSPDAARRALDVLAGATHASAATTAVQDTRRVSTQILDRLWNIGGGEIDARTLLQQLGSPSPLPAFVNCFAPVEVPPPRTPPTIVTAWGEAFGDFGHDGADRNGAGLDRKLGGFVVGYDAPLHGLGTPVRVGVAGGYTGNTFSGSGSGGASSAGSFESVFVSLYGGARFGAVDLRGGTAVAGTSTTVNRTVAYPGFLEAEHSVYGGNTEQVFGEVGYRFSGTRWVVEPIANAAYIHVHQDGYRERGGAVALVGFGQDEDVGTTTLGARGEYAPFVGVPLVGRAFLGWRHAFGDVNPASRLAFEAGSIPFTSQGAALDRNALASEAGLDWRLSEAVTLGVAYIGQVGPRDIDNGVKGRMEVKF